MVCEKSVEEIDFLYGEDVLGHLEVEDVLRKEGLQFEYCNGYSVESGYVYLVDVPSLQQKAALHKVVVDFRDPNERIVLDPKFGIDEAYYPQFIGRERSLPFGNAIRVWRKGGE